MVHKGYLAFNGNELVNNARAKGYASTADCGINWIVGDACSGLLDALDSISYDHKDITLAPWYDPDLPDLSSRFYGLYAADIQGIDDSTQTATMVEGITDGGRIGRSRRATRPIRVRAVLSARGADALEYGKSWLDSVLSGHSCGSSAGNCGVAEVEYFASCPPERAQVTDISDWGTVLTNLFTSPGFDDPSVVPVGAYRDSTWSVSPGGYSLFVPSSDATWNVLLDEEDGLSEIETPGTDLVGAGIGGVTYELHPETRLQETDEPGIYRMVET